ncbi:glycosyltransferase family 2 protein [Propioniciclava sp. MC1595]|uniref:glycosyltransferase family 2 protein n=1 Tax=Propioniciclava sp. MC1595 TaxID=2760308 RepID=UPI0016627793|nr:glycosyltransferase [Propioniciclava sp. MC1595]MBB1494970.1 glycosyltransferase family 2 protein [Propioniciclava sp. MC1595]QTE25588.1 glycosyltransferase family 2 protein [Propioniciclava sp. MC1595]
MRPGPTDAQRADDASRTAASGPRLDIVVPYWGDPEYMRQTVRSVLAQTSDAWRLLVSDDAYPDPWLGPWLAELGDPRIQYHRKESNEGLISNFRTSVRLAEAPLLMVLGSDDRLLPTFVESVLRASDAFPCATIIQPGVRVIGSDGEPAGGLADAVKQRLLAPSPKHPHVLAGEEVATSLLHGDWLYWPSLVFRTAAIQSVDFRDEYSIILDLELILSLIERGASLLVWPEVTFEYRRHAASESSTALLDGTRFAGERQFFDEIASRMSALGWTGAARAARLHATSRLHAATILPRAVAERRPDAVRALARHAFGR